MATTNKDFRVKNGLIVDGATATVNGNTVLTNAASINALSDVTISSPTSGQVLKWNGSAWINDTDATGEGGAGNSFTTVSANGTSVVADSSTDTLTITPGDNVQIVGNATSDTITFTVNNALSNITSIVTPNYITFDTTPTGVSTDAGTMYWDSGDGIPKVILNANVSIGMGQESILLVKNATGSTLPKGSVVYINGAQGQNPTIALADADTEATSSKTFGFVAEQILDTAEGYVITEGILRGVNTASFTEGGAIWLSSTAGQYTQTIPAEPAHSVFLGYAVKAHASAGEVIVKIQNGYELTELHGVVIEESLADNEILAYDFTSGLWKNQTAEEAGVANLSGATFTGNVAGTNANLSGNVNAVTVIANTINLSATETQAVVDLNNNYTYLTNTYTVNLASGNYFSNITLTRAAPAQAWTYVANTRTTTTAASGTFTLPSGMQNGDYVAIVIGCDSTGTYPNVTTTTYGTWTVTNSGSTTHPARLFVKRITDAANETSVAYTTTAGATAIAALAIRNAASTATAINNTTAVSASFNPPATTTSYANAAVFIGGFTRDIAVTAVSHANAAYNGNLASISTSGLAAGVNAAVFLGFATIPTVSAEDPATFTVTGGTAGNSAAFSAAISSYVDPTINLTNPSLSATYPASTYVLHINNPSTLTTTWSGQTFAWQGGTAPTLSSTSPNNIVILETVDGTTFRGAALTSYA